MVEGGQAVDRVLKFQKSHSSVGVWDDGVSRPVVRST
jgi:hypothetical protein